MQTLNKSVFRKERFILIVNVNGRNILRPVEIELAIASEAKHYSQPQPPNASLFVCLFFFFLLLHQDIENCHLTLLGKTKKKCCVTPKPHD